MTPQPSDWRHLAEQASNEMDPNKLIDFVIELDRKLAERENMSRRAQRKVKHWTLRNRVEFPLRGTKF